MSSAAKKRRKPSALEPSPPFQILSEPPSGLFPSKKELLKLFAVVAIAASVAVACNYTAGVLNRRPRPFCDSGDAFQASVPDFCEPCPDNGQCSNGELECFHGYKKQGRICLEDGEINQTAKKLSEWVQQHVCDAYARVLCDEAGKIWFQESDILEVLDEHKSKESIGLKDDAFILAKHKVMEIVESSLETRAILNGNKEFKCPDLLAELHKPLYCCIRQWICGHVPLLVTISVLLVGLIRLLWKVRWKLYLSKRAEQIYAQVCEILEDNAMMAKSINNGGEPWVVASWLRDHLLLPRERKDTMLWKKVEELVLEDSRIDQYPKLIKGESKIVLEWQVDGPLSSKMRLKGAASKTKLSSHVENPSIPQQRKAQVGEPQHS